MVPDFLLTGFVIVAPFLNLFTISSNYHNNYAYLLREQKKKIPQKAGFCITVSELAVYSEEKSPNNRQQGSVTLFIIY